MYDKDQELSKLTLGQKTHYTSEYQPSLLQGVSRKLNRDTLAITQEDLPFSGEDVWYGYELSWLNLKGKPVVAVAEFRFSCTSSHIVESKSFKLYLNSFNQSRFESLSQVEKVLAEDLSKIANTSVTVTLFNVEHCPALAIASPHFQCIDDLDISIQVYELNPKLLTIASNTQVEEKLVSHLLKSNCLITNQPDWASIYISYSGKKICHESLLQYLISFRQHNEFHEQCVERIFCDISHYCSPSELTVFARYTRRGGLDINPYRSSFNQQAPALRTLRQ